MNPCPMCKNFKDRRHVDIDEWYVSVASIRIQATIITEQHPIYTIQNPISQKLLTCLR